MEADWSADIGPGFDVIDAGWPGFIDLRGLPDALTTLPETADNPALREALARLNAPESPVFTCKCDVWPLGSEEVDPWEYDLPPSEKYVGLASYIDLVARDAASFVSFERQESWARGAVARLREWPPGAGRVEVVIRTAVAGDRAGFGITLYAAGCGVDAPAARAAWELILRAAVTATMDEAAALIAAVRGE